MSHMNSVARDVGWARFEMNRSGDMRIYLCISVCVCDVGVVMCLSSVRVT